MYNMKRLCAFQNFLNQYYVFLKRVIYLLFEKQRHRESTGKKVKTELFSFTSSDALDEEFQKKRSLEKQNGVRKGCTVFEGS